MEAEAKELWVIVECPHCNRPQTVNRYIKDNQVRLEDERVITCPICKGISTLTLVEWRPEN